MKSHQTSSLVSPTLTVLLINHFEPEFTRDFKLSFPVHPGQIDIVSHLIKDLADPLELPTFFYVADPILLTAQREADDAADALFLTPEDEQFSPVFLLTKARAKRAQDRADKALAADQSFKAGQHGTLASEQRKRVDNFKSRMRDVHVWLVNVIKRSHDIYSRLLTDPTIGAEAGLNQLFRGDGTNLLFKKMKEAANSGDVIARFAPSIAELQSINVDRLGVVASVRHYEMIMERISFLRQREDNEDLPDPLGADHYSGFWVKMFNNKSTRELCAESLNSWRSVYSTPGRWAELLSYYRSKLNDLHGNEDLARVHQRQRSHAW